MVLAVHNDPTPESCMHWPPMNVWKRNENHRFGGEWPPSAKLTWGESESSAQGMGDAGLQKGESKHDRRTAGEAGGVTLANGDAPFGGLSEEAAKEVQARAAKAALSSTPTLPASTAGLEALRDTWTTLHAWSESVA